MDKVLDPFCTPAHPRDLGCHGTADQSVAAAARKSGRRERDQGGYRRSAMDVSINQGERWEA